jgi:thioredoxin reductase/bacterioferritin-associated ferredoxin
MNGRTECAVIGAGPAGLAAAMAAAEAGVEVTVIDSEPEPGGQIYKAIDESPLSDIEKLGSDYVAGASLVSAFRQSGVRHVGATDVWFVTRDGDISLVRNDEASVLHAERIVIATGAQERPVPFEGWTLPGVMNAGAGQVLVKSAGAVPANGVVLAGLGPLVLLVAWQYVRLGVAVRAILDLTPMANYVRAAPRLLPALLAGNYLAKGLRMHWDLRRAGVPIHTGVTCLRALGTSGLDAVEFETHGRTRRIETPILMTHFGLIPDTTLTRALGLKHDWDASQQCWRPRVDIWGRSDQDGVLITGDARGIFGAKSAAWSGSLAGMEVAHSLGRRSEAERDAESAHVRKAITCDSRVRPFLERLYALPDGWWRDLPDSVIVCRCEEVTAGRIRGAVRAGAVGPNLAKSFTRAGMGPCQGRQCGTTVARLIAEETGRPVGEIDLPRSRFPLKPVALGILATLDLPGLEKGSIPGRPAAPGMDAVKAEEGKIPAENV